jgi:transposase-like protein
MDRKTHMTGSYSAEFRERAVQMVEDHLESYRGRSAAVRDMAQKLGCSSDSLRVWYKQAQRNTGKEAGPTSAEKARIKELAESVIGLFKAEVALLQNSPPDGSHSGSAA